MNKTIVSSLRGLLLVGAMGASVMQIVACGATVTGGGAGCDESAPCDDESTTGESTTGDESTTGWSTTGGMTTGGWSTTGGMTTGSGPPVVSNDAIALLQSQFNSDMGNTTAGPGSGGGQDPESLHVLIGDHQLACAEPWQELECGPHWKVSVIIPPVLQAPGVYSLEQLQGFMEQTGEPYENTPGCGWGGGTFWAGTVQIHSIDATQVVLTIDNSDDWLVDVDGTYTALRCP